ncbi:helicase domino isoform X1 [Tribolium madens]|uniref:helicase domino isoform X1 n=1 Tax=Tribolium madens TaxID=41895 RepID=UPI001CF74002|nr:helicase domino isoform X1 [Tribolium madens]
MSDETPGATQGALPPREGQQASRAVAERPAVRLTQVAGAQYVLTTSQPHGVPALAQITPGTLSTQGGVTRIISISPSRINQTSPLRPSQANQSIVNVLTKPRPNTNVRLQLFPTSGSETSSSSTMPSQTSPTKAPVKRLLPSTPEKKDTYAAKLQRVMNHRIVKSKLIKEKYNEHLMEAYFLEAGGNILDLYQFSKKPKSPAYLAYLKEHAIDPKENMEEQSISQIVPSTPTATSASSLPGISHTQSNITATSTPLTNHNQDSKLNSSKVKTPTNHQNVSNQEQIVEKAKQEAYVVQRIADLQKEGLWSEKRLPKVQEMHRAKAHWDFLLEEMVWLAADFAQERKWKKAAAKKCARMVQKYFQDKALAAQRAEKAQEQHLRRIAAFCAKEIRNFWNNVEKLVEYKQNTILEEKRKKALDQQLSFIVDQTEKYSQLLAEGMNRTNPDNVPASAVSSRSASRNNSDDEFHPDSHNSTDDEETIAQEEAAGGESTDQNEEVAALQRESEMDLDDFLKELPKDYLQNRDSIRLSDLSASEDGSDTEDRCDTKASKSDEDFSTANVSSDEDDEDTIQEQEQAEGKQDHQQELEDLKAENDMSIDELRKKYSGPPPSVSDDEDVKMSDVSDDEYEESVEESDSSEENDISDTDMEVSENDSQGDDLGLKSLLEDSHNEGEDAKTDKNNDLINDAAAIAESIQPKGNTLSSTNVSTKVPFLLKLPLREYQHIGLDWLVTMYERKLNGILADEMGLGKTIQTIALLTHLACEKENWGPHLIVVPTSVMLNWEMECKKWSPAFKILTYYGTQKERKLKRMGWTKPNAFHICITSYKLVIQDHQSFRRKKWKYLILDEAQNIKNFKSQRWQLLLNFQTQQRLLLTGTPLQNNLMELWSLMHFLMPNVFQSHREFKEWFSNPVTGMIEGNSEYNENIIKRLHKVLRPFLLRRLKSEVEKQMPKKYEHVVMCRLSKRQRFLYDDYMSRAKTRETLASGNLLSVINVLMQLRKVCNHPNLFEVRPTISPFLCDGIVVLYPSLVYAVLEYNVWKQIDFLWLNLNLIFMEYNLSAYQSYRMKQMRTPRKVIEIYSVPEEIPPPPPCRLMMRIKKHEDTKTVPLKVEKRDVNGKNPQTSQNIKVKVPQYGVQLVQQGIVKAIPVNISQPLLSNQTATPVSVTSMLKPSDKISASFAQLVQTSTGKHLLLTPNPSISGNIPVSTTTAGGQKLTFLSKQPLLTAGNSGHQITKAFMKIQLTSVAATTTNTITTSTPPAAKTSDKEERKTVGPKFIDQLYANQSNNLDVRWDSDGITNDVGSSDEMDLYKDELKARLQLMAKINEQRCSAVPLYGEDFRQIVTIENSFPIISLWKSDQSKTADTECDSTADMFTCFKELVRTPENRIEQLADICDRFIFYVPAVRAPEPEMQIWHPSPSTYWGEKEEKKKLAAYLSAPATSLHRIASAMVTQFPDPRLIQYDCGKLQTLDKLLRKLKTGGHRVLIFTQMTKMLDVLEAFLNFHGHIYLRLDGTTKVDQRQLLMERFNGDTRIFAFILSTRSGGIGVNLTGADTVIFYDSDWNPTMDAQAQDRCHRIGQTRDVHIYRLVSERTIEENILKKANQKRLLGDLAIEGGNFTTAYFKSSTIQDLFNIDSKEESAASRMSEVVESHEKRAAAADQSQSHAGGDDKAALGALENALAACEDDQDVQAARTAKAEAVADLAEFDENIPLEDQEKEPEMSKAEQEIDNVIKKLSPIERYAMKFIEETESAWSAEQLAAAEREIEEQKREWEQNRLAAMREEEERRARELEEENDLLTFSREDATNQIWVSDNTMEQMPMWCPPTPPQQDTDIYIDQTMSFLYDMNIMSESQLPPIYVKKEAKRTRHDAGFVDSRRALKIPRKEESMNAPKSLFHSATSLKMKRDLKLQKYRGLMRNTLPISGKTNVPKPAIETPLWHDWTVHEDMALLKVIQSFQGLPLNLLVASPGHTPNWDFVSDYVNTVSITYRSPKQCRQRYETVLIQREEGKQVFDNSVRKKKNKSGSMQKFSFQQKSNRPMRTSQLYTQDNNSKFSQIMLQRYDALKTISNKRAPPQRSVSNNPSLKNPKHTAMLTECGIDLDHPVLPVEVAARRAERLAREKKPLTAEQQLARFQMMKGLLPLSQASTSTTLPQVVAVSSGTAVTTATQSQVTIAQTINVVTSITTTVSSAPATPPNTIRSQRIITSPLQASTVVSVAGLSPAQLQAATQRLIVSGSSPGQTKTEGTPTAIQAKSISSAQLQLIKQAGTFKPHVRLQSGTISGQAVKNSTVTISGQQAVVQFTQAQPRAQFVRQGTVTVGTKAGITRTVTESEVTQLLKKQQQQKTITAAVATGSQASNIQGLSSQVLAQAVQQAGTSGTQVATLVKAVSNTGGVTQTVTIPVSGVTIANSGKTVTPTIKAANTQQIRQFQIQQQLLAHKKLGTQKLNIAQVGGKNNVQTQLIVGPKPLSTAMTVQQFTQVMRAPLGITRGPVVLAKGTPRVIPVNTSQGTKQTIQVVAATSQALNSALRPQSSSTLAGALAGIKVQGQGSTQAQLLSQVSAALQNQTVVRQGSPVRLQSGASIVAVTVQPTSNVQQGTTQTSSTEQVSRFMKK